MYTLLGYTGDLIDFEFTVTGFVEAVRLYRVLNLTCVVWLNREGKPGTCLHVR